MRGVVFTVEVYPARSYLNAPAEVDDVAIVVSDATPFGAEGAQVSLAGVIYDVASVTFGAASDDPDVITLATPVTAAAEAGEPLEALPSTTVTSAEVLVDGADDTVWATIEQKHQSKVDLTPGPTTEPRPIVDVEVVNGRHVVTAIDGRGLDDASMLTGSLPSDLAQDDTAPTASPDAIVAPAGVGGIRVSWVPVAWARAYDVYASLESGVTTASEYVGTSTGSSQTFDSLSDVRLPTEGELVYAAVVARNDAGAAPIGVEGSATPRKADLAELNVEQLNANIVEAVTAIFGALNVEIAFIGGRLTLGNVEGAHIILDPAVGLVFYDLDGQTVLGKLDITAAQASELSLAVLTAWQARITNLELYGQMSRIMNGSIVELVSAVPSPEQPPSLTAALGSRPWIAPPSGYVECGMSYETATGYWWQLLYRSDVNRLIVRAINSAGVQVGSDVQLRNLATVGSSDFGVDIANGLVKLGGYFYVLRRRKAGDVGSRQWLLIKYVTVGDPAEAFDAVIVGSEQSPGSTGAYPTLGLEGSTLVATSLSTTCRLTGHASGQTGFVRWSTSLLAGTAGIWSGDIGNGLYARGCGIDTLSEYGGVRFWAAHTSRVYFFTISGTTLTVDPNHPWFDLDGNTTVTARGATVDGTRFHSTSATNTLKVYSNYLDTNDDARTFWAQYAWESGTDATAPSPAGSFVLPDRRYLTVGLPQRAAGTSLTRVFTGRGATEPARTAMYSRGTTAGASVQVASHVTSGENPQATSDFTEGTPALLRSQGGALQLWGDGTIHVPDPLMPTDAANKQYVDALEARVAALESA